MLCLDFLDVLFESSKETNFAKSIGTTAVGKRSKKRLEKLRNKEKKEKPYENVKNPQQCESVENPQQCEKMENHQQCENVRNPQQCKNVKNPKLYENVRRLCLNLRYILGKKVYEPYLQSLLPKDKDKKDKNSDVKFYEQVCAVFHDHELELRT